MNPAPRKKVLFVITKSNWGGAQRYVYDLATHLPGEKVEVAVALGGTGSARASAGQLDAKLKEAGVRTLFVHAFMRDISVFKELQAFAELWRLMKRERPEVVHLNSSKAGGLGALAARLAGVRTILFTVHGWPFWEKRGLASRGLIWLACWITALLSTRVIVISDYDLRVARRMPFVRRKLVRIYNGIDLHAPLGSGERIRDAFPEGASIVGTIGELTRNKNQIALVEEARNDPNRFVAIVGEGELRGFLERKISEYGLEERVKLLGFIPAKEALRGFDEFALPSLKEGLPYVLLEAKAAGLPIRASRVGGVGEILDAPDMREFSVEEMVRRTATLYGI